MPGPSGAYASTTNANVRSSPGEIAPTPTTWRVTSSPRSLRIEMTTAYSHGSPLLGGRIAPSTRSGDNVGIAAVPSAPGSKRRCLRHEGQTLALWRMTARQCGQTRVLPGTGRVIVLTTPGAHRV